MHVNYFQQLDLDYVISFLVIHTLHRYTLLLNYVLNFKHINDFLDGCFSSLFSFVSPSLP